MADAIRCGHPGAGAEGDRRFVERFRAAAIPAHEWSHEAHLRIAFLHLRQYPFGDAVRRMRRGIRRLNRAHGVVESDAAGYHETLTLAWARLVAAALATAPPEAHSHAFLAANRELCRQELVLRHYSPERLGSPRARREFVLPDRAPLPVAPAAGAPRAAE